MATRMGLAPSGYTPPPSPYATSGYDPTQAPPMRRLVSGGKPTTPGIVEYRPPAYDEAKIKAYQQEAMAPGISELRRTIREGQAGRYASPTARREAMRGLTRGAGEALASLQVGAGKQARGRYDIQYQQQVRAEEQRVAALKRQQQQEYQQSLIEEARGEQEEADRVVVGYRAGGAPIYMTRDEAAGHFATIEREEASKYPPPLSPTAARSLAASSEPTYDRSLQPEPLSSEPAYSSNWMY